MSQPVSESSHLRLSLATVAVFAAMGLWLEAMFGLRLSGWVDDPLRREFLRLGHAHGALIGIANLGLSWAMSRLGTPPAWAARVRIAGIAAAVCVGLGFFGGGIWHAAHDPGPLVLIVPAGAMMFVAAVVAVAMVRPRGDDQSRPNNDS